MSSESAELERALQVAMERVLIDGGWLTDGVALGDWIIFAELTPFKDEEIGNTRYAQIMSEAGVPWHRILGLVQVGREQLYQQMRDPSE